MAGCQAAADDAGVRRWESEHFVYYSSERDGSVCPGVVATLERHFAAIRSTLGLEWPDGHKVAYHKFRSQRGLRGAGVCSARNAACFIVGRGVFTTKAFDLHELVHAYLEPLGNSHPVLEEGIAAALACDLNATASPPEMTLADAFSEHNWASNERAERRALYQAAAWFTADVLRRQGGSGFTALYRELRLGQSLETMQGVYARLFAEPLSVAWQRALSSEGTQTACVPSWECASSEYPTAGAVPWFERCEQDDRAYAVTLTEPSWIGVEWTGPGVRFEACDESYLATAEPVPRSEMAWKLLAPGRYFVASGRADIAVGLTLEGAAHRATDATACETLESMSASFPRALTIELAADTVPPSPSETWLRIDDVEREGSSDYRVTCSADLEVQWCRSCDAFTCERVCDPADEVPVRRFGDEDIVLRLRRRAAATASFAPSWLELVRAEH